MFKMMAPVIDPLYLIKHIVHSLNYMRMNKEISSIVVLNVNGVMALIMLMATAENAVMNVLNVSSMEKKKHALNISVRVLYANKTQKR